MSRYVVLILFFFGCFRQGPALAQELEKTLPKVQTVAWGEPGSHQNFKQEDLQIDVRHKRILRDTREFDFTAYHDRASAEATGCQVFKEQGQDLWWANCGKPIHDFVVLSSASVN